MKDIIDQTKLEKLLTKNWTQFIDQKKLIAYTLTCVRNHNFKHEIKSNKKFLAKVQNHVQITISNVSLKPQGIYLWVEFKVPKENAFIIGTTELLVDKNLDVNHIQTIGTVFK